MEDLYKESENSQGIHASICIQAGATINAESARIYVRSRVGWRIFASASTVKWQMTIRNTCKGNGFEWARGEYRNHMRKNKKYMYQGQWKDHREDWYRLN